MESAPNPIEPIIHSQYVTQKNGISRDRIANTEKITIIEDLIKCSICLEIICKPYECEVCGSLFCEDCINEWLKINPTCPMRCENFKLIHARPNTRKMLNLIKLKCINYPECKVILEYWDMFNHEEKCPFQKIKCPHFPCEFSGSFKELQNHLINICDYICIECGFCKCRIPRNEFDSHLEEHCKDKTFNIPNCSICNSDDNIRRCLCKKCFCKNCLIEGRNENCCKNCYVFQNGLNTTNNIYNISKFTLPKNFEAKILFNSVDWVRTGITFNKDIIKEQNDVNCPKFDIYCILEDLIQFYTLKNEWKNCFKKGGRPLKAGDTMTITLRNGEMRYAINDVDLGNFIKIDMANKKEMYLLIHTRNSKSKAQIIYICEIFN
jgi:hypothetical protein